ncbi:unnamed protein product [Owenia fusiformis]|uniref:Uncharacterized protein n=1 Tax=Owenia fusiformis TaxID=6347 RepID=A0A8J1TYK7_OWEFU|nr:unnamed protein product [Owenia fusiformis]
MGTIMKRELESLLQETIINFYKKRIKTSESLDVDGIVCISPHNVENARELVLKIHKTFIINEGNIHSLQRPPVPPQPSPQFIPKPKLMKSRRFSKGTVMGVKSGPQEEIRVPVPIGYLASEWKSPPMVVPERKYESPEKPELQGQIISPESHNSGDLPVVTPLHIATEPTMPKIVSVRGSTDLYEEQVNVDQGDDNIGLDLTVKKNKSEKTEIDSENNNIIHKTQDENMVKRFKAEPAEQEDDNRDCYGSTGDETLSHSDGQSSSPDVNPSLQPVFPGRIESPIYPQTDSPVFPQRNSPVFPQRESPVFLQHDSPMNFSTKGNTDHVAAFRREITGRFALERGKADAIASEIMRNAYAAQALSNKKPQQRHPIQDIAYGPPYGKRRRVCNHCNRTFSTKSNLNRHYLEQHKQTEEKWAHCKICGVRNYMRHMKRHYKDKHPDALFMTSQWNDSTANEANDSMDNSTDNANGYSENTTPVPSPPLIKREQIEGQVADM